MTTRRGPIVAVGIVVLIVGVLAVVGQANPVRRAPITTDRLGPVSGDTVSDYIDSAAASVDESDGSDESARWALVSFASDSTTTQVAATTAGVRVSEVYVHVPIPRVQTQVLTVPVSAHPAALAGAVTAAAEQVNRVAVSDTRATAVSAVTRSRLLSDCACVPAVLVRANTSSLTALAANPDVRAVEALPADSVYGDFAVNPLLPEQTDVIDVAADDGVVPDF